VAVIRQLVTASVAEEPHPRNRLRPRRHRRTGDGQIFGSRNAARRRAYGGGNPADRSRPSLSDRQRCSVAGTLSIVTYVQETFLRRSWSTSRSQKSVLRRAIMSIGPVRDPQWRVRWRSRSQDGNSYQRLASRPLVDSKRTSACTLYLSAVFGRVEVLRRGASSENRCLRQSNCSRDNQIVVRKRDVRQLLKAL
jgi:hypothetical protein